MFDSSDGQEDSPSTQLSPRDKRKKVAKEREYIFLFLLIIEHFKNRKK